MILCGLRNATFMTLNENESLPSPGRLMRRKPSQFSLFINHMPNQTRQADFYPTIFPTFFHFPRKFRDQKARLSGKEFQTINFYIEGGYVQSMITAKIVLVPILKSSAFDKFPSRTLLAQGLMAGLQPTSYLSITIELKDEPEQPKHRIKQANTLTNFDNKGLTLALKYIQALTMFKYLKSQVT